MVHFVSTLSQAAVDIYFSNAGYSLKNNISLFKKLRNQGKNERNQLFFGLFFHSSQVIKEPFDDFCVKAIKFLSFGSDHEFFRLLSSFAVGVRHLNLIPIAGMYEFYLRTVKFFSPTLEFVVQFFDDQCYLFNLNVVLWAYACHRHKTLIFFIKFHFRSQFLGQCR